MSRLKGVVGASLSSQMMDLKVVDWLKEMHQGAVSAVFPVIILLTLMINIVYSELWINLM